MPPKYFVPEFVSNPFARFKYRYIDNREPMPAFPKVAQIQTVSGCNANCVFCPNAKTELEIPLGRRMDMDLYKRIIDQIVEGGVRRISPYLMNESMLDPQLPERVAYITQKKQKHQFSKINSHGGLLTERMAKGLLDAGLDRLNFSVQGLDPEIYEKIMGIKLEKVLKNIDRFLEFKRAGNYKMRVRIVMLDTIEVHPQLDHIKKYWGERGVKINLNKLENRGHHKNIQSDAIAVRPLKNFDWCTRMFEQVYILFDGRMAMCCADWEQTGIMGDLSKQTLAEAWQSPQYADYRRRFLDGNVKGMLCDGCTKDEAGQDEEDD